MKFRRGDRVRVKDNSKYEGGMYAGRVGVIRMVNRSQTWPYDVKFDDGGGNWFHANELEKVEEEKVDEAEA